MLHGYEFELMLSAQAGLVLQIIWGNLCLINIQNFLFFVKLG
jgi:hypothetical protein